MTNTMRLYYFVDAKWGLDDIRRRRLKISTIDGLNDPFELMGVAFSDPEYRRKHRSMREGLTRLVGLLCFSKNRKNPVQWSHYADRHRGLCLGFDVTAELHEVIYAAGRLKADLSVLERHTDAAELYMRRLLLTKFSHWSYEEEYRLFCELKEGNRDPASGMHFYDFDESLRLREAFVGPLSTITQDELADAIGGLGRVKTFKTRLAFRTFEVVKQKNKELWR